MQHRSKLPNLETTIFSVMSSLAQQHKAINLSQGFPDFQSDKTLHKLVTQAMRDGYNQYAPMLGTFGLRNAIAQKFDHLYESTYHPETEIIVTAGATQAIYTAITAFIRPGDEVIVFTPAYDCYVPAIKLNGGTSVSIQLEAPNYKIDWEMLKVKVTAKTKMIIVNTPHNPSGAICTKEDMMKLQDITRNTNIVVLSDEVYEHIIFDDQAHQSVCLFPELKSRSIIVASFGKTFHNTGWKVGYCCGPKELMQEFVKVHQYNVFSVNHPVQKALAVYLQNPNYYEALSEFYQKKRDLFLNLIKDSRLFCVPAQGTYFQTVNYSAISNENDEKFAKWMTVEKGVAVIPVSVFNHDKYDQNMLRICFAKTDDTLKRAAEILNQI
ncbi:MAG: aminotransferase class I/II-fold pyridoxal phosphate-dependent enzyme [Flavobacteriaceae bacterium]|nr:aminotransferase class I/II-fold pyridoxal phosphate-dependent enzyme [Flavobacteriaceae bacterium]